MKAALAVALLVAATGCATKAQQEATRIQDVAAVDAPIVDACWRRAVASAPYQSLKARMGEHSDSPTDAMKLDPSKATSAEAAQVLLLRRDYLAPCRKIALESAGKVHPAIVAILAQNYAKADENTAKFTSRGITWGAFVTENQALVTERRAQLLAAGESMQRRLGQPQATDAADRQRAEAALSSWAHRQQSLLPSQPATACQFVGPTLACTSR